MTYRTANLQSYILYIYSTNIGTEYFKHGIYSPSFSLQNAVCFIILTYLIPVLFTFYIQGVLKLQKKNNSGAKRLKTTQETTLGPFRVTASNAAIAAVPACCKSGSKRFSSMYCSYNGLCANQMQGKYREWFLPLKDARHT